MYLHLKGLYTEIRIWTWITTQSTYSNDSKLKQNKTDLSGFPTL